MQSAIRTATIRRKVFIAYHHADEETVTRFMKRFGERNKIFITRALGEEMPGDVINSDNARYVMDRIRDLYLQDSTVTIVMLGRCTWARRYVDWELQSSLRSGEQTTPNGVLGVQLPSTRYVRNPPRLERNLPNATSRFAYARRYPYPKDKNQLVGWIEDAYAARTSRKHLIENPRERFMRSKVCP